MENLASFPWQSYSNSLSVLNLNYFYTAGCTNEFKPIFIVLAALIHFAHNYNVLQYTYYTKYNVL